MIMILAGLYMFLWGKRKEQLEPESQENPKDELRFQSEDKIKDSGSHVWLSRRTKMLRKETRHLFKICWSNENEAPLDSCGEIEFR